MTTLMYNIVRAPDGASTVSVFYEGRPYITTNENPRFDEIVRRVKEDDVTVIDLFDYARKIVKEFRRLSERVTVRNGKVLFNGDPVDDAVSGKIIAFIEAGEDDWKPLVAFLEKVMQNPSEYSRSQLYRFLDHNHFAITENGDILGYKGLSSTDTPNVYRSYHYGSNLVSVNDEEPKDGYVFQKVGDVVEMARSDVDDNHNQGCSAGLHVSNFDYAQGGYTYSGPVMAVLFSPADVVSVPSDDQWQKVRVHRYRNFGLVTKGHDTPLVREADILKNETPQKGQFAVITGPYYYNDGELIEDGPDQLDDLQDYLALGTIVMIDEIDDGSGNHVVSTESGDLFLVAPNSLELCDQSLGWSLEESNF